MSKTLLFQAIKLSQTVLIETIHCPVGWDCRIHWLHLRRDVRLPPPVELEEIKRYWQRGIDLKSADFEFNNTRKTELFKIVKVNFTNKSMEESWKKIDHPNAPDNIQWKSWMVKRYEKWVIKNLLFFLQTVVWFHILPCNNNNPLFHQSFICTLLKVFNY